MEESNSTETKSYIGTKVIRACLSARINEETQETQAGYKVLYEDGYESWSPKEVFERCYREITDKEKILIS